MEFRTKRIGFLPAVVLLSVVSVAAPAAAQLRIALPPVQPRIQAEAFTGGRFGVGLLTVDPSKEMLGGLLGAEGLAVKDRDGRVLYPVLSTPPLAPMAKELFREGSPLASGGPVREEVGGLVRSLLERPPRTKIYFLFRGDGPLELTLEGASKIPLTITPRRNPAANRQLLQQWWSAYTAAPRLLETRPDYPPLVENYLKSTLARRLSLDLPRREQTDSWQDQLEQALGLSLGTETVRLAMQQDRILGLNELHLPADEALPDPVDAAEIEYPPVPEGVEIEPIAKRVPAECFYMRFGSFGNFLWMNDTLEKWGGDFQNLLASRGLDYGRQQRTEDQLLTKQTVLSRLLGGTMISDVAIIGTDMFFREGAAYGILFEARQTDVLGTALVQERLKRLKQGGVAEEQIEIGEHTVSFISSPDGRVRSYYAVSGDYHFITTSERLARRFLETSSGIGALGTSAGFRHARASMPLGDDYTVFIYFSDAFYRYFTSPHYRVEMARRLQAASDVDLVQLAVLASATEGKPGETIDELIGGELLPEDFARRPDGSRTVLVDGEVFDSLRGYRGAFLPVPDTPVEKVGRAEAAAYRRFAEFYREKWDGRMDPTIIGVKREALKGGQETIVLNAHLSPFAAEHFEFLSKWAGEPDTKELAPVEGNLISAELVLKDQTIFLGLTDFGPPQQIDLGTLFGFCPLRDVLVGYIGTTGRVGLLSFLNIRIASPPDARGYATGPLGLWRRTHNGFTVYSLHPEVLASVTPQLRFQESERAAQLRLDVRDLSHARMTPLLNDLGYRRTRDTSLGNIRLMHAIEQQLHVPPEDCLQAAEFLLDAKLVCPLGGQYVYQQRPDGTGWWTSTAMPEDVGKLLGSQAPEGYQAPPLSWFRGLKLDAAMTRNVLSAHAEVIMQSPQ
ncbi:MAG TPA: hypothetical protein VMY42_04390 [Thermoguttaceae bacterium]|nr:hypothetical protein [Thermoguttaceae bacterium]